MPIPRSPLLRQLRQAVMDSLRASDAETFSALQAKASRRGFLRQSAAASATLGGLSLTACSTGGKKRKPEIGILGAGMAGLHAAYLLKKAGIRAKVYDSSERTGGRIYSKSHYLAEGLTTELGGEFIDSNHADMLALAKEFNLPLLDMKSDTGVDKIDFYFNNTRYSQADFTKAFKPFGKAIAKDISSLPDELTYQNARALKTFDTQNIIQYLNTKGIKGWLLDLFNVAFTTEYGLEASQQSALNFLNLFSVELAEESSELFGESDERFKIAGGNQRLVDELAQRIPDIYLSYEVEKISTAGPGYRVLFRNGEDIYFDYLICTIPFTRLRQVTLDIADLPPLKRQAINELGYGVNAKAFLGFNKRLWRDLGFSGDVFANTGIQLAWDNSRLQPGSAGGLTVFTGGNASAEMQKHTPPELAALYLKRLNKIYPSLQQFYNGQHGLFYWPQHVHTLGSYACYTQGQWSRFAGVEAEPVGRLFFAGEHCSADFQGYMNGAAETGRKAALALVKAL